MDEGRAGGGPPVRLHRAGDVAVLVIDAPPVNALGQGVRAGLAEGLAAALADPEVRALVIRAEGRTFPAGADIAEFGRPPAPPLLPDLLDRIEASPKPVVAAIHGQALGGGLELALAAHARIALADAKLGLPEVTLGILPGAGGTQRLPRLAGAEASLRLMLSGRPVAAPEAQALGILDAVVAEGLEEAAVTLARALPGPRPTRDRDAGLRDPSAFMAAVAAARARLRASPLPAPARIVDCVEATLLLPFEAGLSYERAAFEDLVASPEAVALRAAFFADRRAARLPGGAPPRPVQAPLVLGAGPQGAAVALGLLGAGCRVTLAEADRPALVAGFERVAAALEEAVAAGRLAPEARDADWARLIPALGYEAAADGTRHDLVVLADAYAAEGLDLPPLAEARMPEAPVVTMGRRGEGGAQAVGLVLWPGQRLAEMLADDPTDPAAVATLAGVLRRMDRLAVPTRGRGIVAPLVAALGAAARHQAGRAGAGAVAAVLARRNLSVQGIAADPGAPPPAPEALDEVEVRLMAALANAGFRLVGEGTALRPSDVDVALVHGLGWPRHVAGPMLWAETRGLILLRAELTRWAADDPAIWTPAPLIGELVRDGIALSRLND